MKLKMTPERIESLGRRIMFFGSLIIGLIGFITGWIAWFR